MNTEAAFAAINGVPVIGARFLDRGEALSAMRSLTRQVARCTGGNGAAVQVGFRPQNDGRFCLELCGGERVITMVPGVDELMLRRFQKAYRRKKMFILTSFVEEEYGTPRSLVVSEGLGVVIYGPSEALQS